MPLAQYLKSFSRLRTYKDCKKWSVPTIFHFALRNLVLWARSEFSGFALEFGV